MAALNGAEWDAVSPRVDAVLVLYDHDGKTPKRRQFKTLDEGVVAFDRLQQFHAALRVKHRAPPNAEVMVLFARASRRSDVWYAARSSGEGVAAVALGDAAPELGDGPLRFVAVHSLQHRVLERHELVVPVGFRVGRV